MSKDKNNNDSYYEMPFAAGPGPKEILLAIAALAFIGIPIYVFLIIAAVFKALGLTSAGYCVLLAVLAVVLVFGWAIFLSKIKLKPLVSVGPRNRRYRLRVPDGYKHFTIIRDEDGGSVRKAERKGAVWFFKEADNSFLGYTYNLFLDKGFKVSDNVRVYEVSKEEFLDFFPYYEEKYFRYDRIWVIPLEDLGTDRDAFRALKNSKDDQMLFIYHADLTDLADGMVNDRDYGVSYRYREIRSSGRPETADVDRFLKDVYRGPVSDTLLRPSVVGSAAPAVMASSAAKASSGRLSKNFAKPMAFAAAKESAPAELSDIACEESDFEEVHSTKLDERISHISDSFSDYLMYLIESGGMDNAEVYKRALVDKKTFSKIKNNTDYHPQKITALCLCVGAKLSLDETTDLLARAGYALSPSDKTDIIFRYFIENGIYDMIELDIQLEEHGLPCIIK